MGARRRCLPGVDRRGLRAQRYRRRKPFGGVRMSTRPGGVGQPLGFQFQGKSSPMRLIGWSAMRASTSRR
jgi:hypothetical protein